MNYFLIKLWLTLPERNLGTCPYKGVTNPVFKPLLWLDPSCFTFFFTSFKLLKVLFEGVGLDLLVKNILLNDARRTFMHTTVITLEQRRRGRQTITPSFNRLIDHQARWYNDTCERHLTNVPTLFNLKSPPHHIFFQSKNYGLLWYPTFVPPSHAFTH
jgi:hypothetical protein